jgi:uncharacterized protein (DUF983 family)
MAKARQTVTTTYRVKKSDMKNEMAKLTKNAAKQALKSGNTKTCPRCGGSGKVTK